MGIQVSVYGWEYELIAERNADDNMIEVTLLNPHNNEVKGLLTQDEFNKLKENRFI